MYLNHPNILKMYGFFDDDSKIYLILELASHGDIYKEIKKEVIFFLLKKKKLKIKNLKRKIKNSLKRNPPIISDKYAKD